VGFEPTKVSLAGFQDRCTRPLCEPSVGKLTPWRASYKKIYAYLPECKAAPIGTEMKTACVTILK
jgi:hypothetical protein